jgi:hypothetical protein
VVGLGDQREAIALEPLDQPRLPQRLGAIQLLGEHARHQAHQLVLAAGLRQRGLAHVVLEVEVRVVDPHRTPGLQRRLRELLPVARHQVQPHPQRVQELLEVRRRALEDRHRPDVHVRVVALLVQERSVDGGQPVEVVLRHGSDPTRAVFSHAHGDP